MSRTEPLVITPTQWSARRMFMCTAPTSEPRPGRVATSCATTTRGSGSEMM